jgi:hypothetical protein
MNNISDTVQNIKEQLTGRDKRGIYARIPTEEINDAASKLQASLKRTKNQDQYQFDKFLKKEKANASNDHLYEHIDRSKYGDDEFDIENVLKNMRASGKEKQEAAKFLLSKIKLKKDEPSRNILQKVVRDNISKQKALQLEGVTQKQTKKILEDALHEANTEDNAATTLSKFIRGHTDRKRYKYLKSEYPQIAAKRKEDVSNITPSLLLQKEFKPVPTNTKSLLEQELTASRERAHKLYEAAIAKPPKKIFYDSMVKSGDIQNAAAARTRRINEKTMKARQLVDDIKVKQLQAVKNDVIKKDAAEKIQKAIRRKNAQNDITKIKQAKEKIQGNVKALLTEKAKIMHLPKHDKTIILNKKTVGQPLAVSKKLQLVSKKKQSAAKEGYVNRLAFLDMAKQYKGIMKKK